MNSQNITKDNKTQQASQTELSKAGKPELAKELMDVQTQNDCFESTQPRIVLDSDKDSTLGVNSSQILTKFEQYQAKILNDTNLGRELNLVVEPLTIHHDDTTGENRLLELSNEITRQLLTSQSSKDPRILLLTGQAGSGKSFFCQHLQREILSIWHNNQESDEDEIWFPIYVELSSLKNPKSEAITEALARELSLTEEEISLLRITHLTHLKLPRLLFIFDGYDEIEDINAFSSLTHKEELVKHNFFELNKVNEEFWKNAKFIITCREENLQKVGRRDLLFGPVSADPGSFLERGIEPFSNEQISLPPTLANCFPSDSSHKSRSWEQVQSLEKLIDRFALREIARVPSMLWIICQILPKITSKNFEQLGEDGSTQAKALSTRFLLEFFISETIKANLKRTSETKDSSKNQEESKGDLEEVESQKVNPYIEAINLQAQNSALRSGGYSVNEIKTQGEVIDDPSLTLKLHPFAKWDGNRSRVKFQYPWIHEFYLAKSIEEEIREKVPSSAIQERKLEIPRDLLINQKLLTYDASNSIVLLLLRDAVNDKRLTTEQLMKLIKLSREKGVEQESNFAFAAANAITVLNAAGYDFSGQDLSNVSIPGANLSYGIFEGTNFKNANLQGVDFTGAWLKDVNLEQGYLANVAFGENLGLRLRNEKIVNIAFSLDGKYLAADVGDETVIFENVSPKKSDFKEARRVPGCFLDCGGSPFHMNAKQIATVIKKGNLNSDHLSFCFWDVISGKCVEKLDAPKGNKTLLNFSPRRKEIMALDSNEIHKYSTVTDSWTKFSLTALDDTEEWKLNAGDCDILLASDSLNKLTTLCSAITGKLILKLKQGTAFCQLSTDGRQIASKINDRIIQVVDTVRGYPMKAVASEQKSDRYSSFRLIGQRFLATIGKELVLRDVSSAQTYLKIPLKTASKDLKDKISINYLTNQVAYFSENTGVVSFEQLPTTTVLPAPTITVRGTNTKGLTLQGVRASSCNKLSEKNIVILQKRGDYEAFPETVLNKLFPSNSEESEAISEVIVVSKKLAPIHARIIGSNTYWSNLRKLNLSKNAIKEEGGEAIGDNKSWPNLQELTLSRTQIGDETAIKVANNHIWKNMKKLELASNKIGDIGAIEIGKSKIWMNLEVLDLRENMIKDEGAKAIGGNNTWEKLKKLDLSLNKINDKQTVILVCSNGTWKDLKYLFLSNNPAVMKATDALEAIGGVASKSLEKIDLPQASFERAFLQCLKYNESECVLELPLSDIWYDALHADIIGLNTTWINLQTINLERNSIGDKGATALSQNTSWTNLKTLCLGNNEIGDEGAGALSQNTSWINLQALSLGYNKIGAEGATALSKNTTWTNLQTLGLGNNRIGDKGATASSQNTTWTNLQSLDLGGNLIGDEGATALSQNTTWTNLQTLNLKSNRIGEEGATALSQNTTWINLQTLHFGYNKIGVKGVTVLSQNITWINLQSLELDTNSIGEEGATALSQNTTWTNLQSLDLGGNKIGVKGVTALSQNTTWIHLQSLELRGNLIGDEGTSALSQNTTWTALQTLTLGSNSIGAEGATALSQNTTWINLQSLDLNNNSIGDKGAAALSHNTTWISLETLDLNNNSIGDKGATALSQNTTWTNLQSLDLGGNLIGDEGTSALSQNTTWTNLQTLSLRSNSIDDEGATALSKNTTWTNLQTLNLGYNEIGAEGATALSQNTTWTSLQTLGLGNNEIGDRGATALGHNTTWTNLQTLTLGSNSIGDKGAIALSQNTTWNNLQTLNLWSNLIGDKGATALSQNTSWINLQALQLGFNKIEEEGAAALSQNKTWTHLKTLDLANNLFFYDCTFWNSHPL